MWKILLFIFSCSLFGVDFRVGRGSYSSDFSILEFMKFDNSYDTTTFAVSNPKINLSDKMFYYYNLEYFTSDKKRAGFEFFEYSRFDILVNRIMCDSESFGGDLDIGVGYDLVDTTKGYLAIAINSGVTLPNISSKNLSKKIELAKKMIDRWDMNIYSYKIGPSFRGEFRFSDSLSLFGSFGFGFQKAYIDSDLFKSSVDTKGSYSSFDLNLKFSPYKMGLVSFSKDIDLKVGYTLKKWSVDSVDVNLFNFFGADIFRAFDLDLKNSYGYIGMEYNF